MIKKGILVGIIFLIQLLMSDSLFAKSIPIRVQSDTLYAGDTLEVFSIERVVDEVRAGDVVVLSEYHDNLTHHLHQKEFLEALTERHPEIKISVGMEFFEYTDQNDVDRFLKGEVEEKVFLEEIKWGSISFDFYRPLVLQPLESKGWTYGINAPRALTSKVSKQGLESLNDQERSLLPPQFELGLDSYKKRFVEVIGGGHPLPERQIERYFTAQSIWDDTMAWQTHQILNQERDQIFVIIVGDFHNAYQDGLVARLRARGEHRVLSISQVDIEGMTNEEAIAEIAPDPEWGVRADFVWSN